MYPAFARPHPLKKAIGVTMIALGLVGSVFLFPLWLFLIYPAATFALAGAGLAALCFHPRSPRLVRPLEWAARCDLVAATMTAVSCLCMLNTGPSPGFDSHYAGWFFFISLLVPQLLWFSRFRSSPAAALVIALASSVPVVEAVVALQDL